LTATVHKGVIRASGTERTHGIRVAEVVRGEAIVTLKRVFTSVTALLVLAAIAFLPVPSGAKEKQKEKAAATGALDTTDSTCTTTNENQYANRGTVYLRGNNLTDGEYYVQVTEPNGTTVLGSSVDATDPTPVTVEDGSIVGCPRLWDLVNKESDHTKGYDATTNNGGEYKVEISQSADFSDRKSDNFKVDDNECEPDDDCDGGEPPAAPECSDDQDNADPEDTLVDEDDPGCHTDGNPDNPNSYDPDDDDETNTGEGPAGDETCSDGIDNDGDGLIDGDDPDCQETPTTGSFSCRASAVRVELLELEPFIANDAQSPCADDSTGLIPQTVLGGAEGDPGSLTIGVLNAITSDDGGGDAEAYVAKVELRDSTGAVVIGANVLRSSASASCDDGLTGNSSVAKVEIGGEIIDISDASEIPLGPLGTLYLNWQENSGGVLTQRALFLDSDVLGDVIVAESIAGIEGDPCP
jgi:hypothetical protein